jgi:hypothetical protein
MIDIKLEGINEALKMYDPKKVITAARQAINRTADSTRTEASRLIREEYNIKATKLNQYLKVETKANGNDLSATISGKGLGLALSYFDAKQAGVMAKTMRIGSNKIKALVTKGGKRYGGAVTALVKRAGGRKVITGKYGNKPFLAQTSSGHIGVYVRKPGTRMANKKKEQIEQQIGPGIGGLFGSKAIMNRIKTTVINKFKTEFNRLLDLKR